MSAAMMGRDFRLSVQGLHSAHTVPVQCPYRARTVASTVAYSGRTVSVHM